MTYREIPSALTGPCPMYGIKLGPRVCVHAELNMSAGCELMVKPCPCWLSTAGVQASFTVRVHSERVGAALSCMCVDHGTPNPGV